MTDDRGENSSPARGSLRRGAKDWAAHWFALDAVARLVVGRDLMVLAINDRAESIIERTGGLGIRDDVLTARDRRSATTLETAVSRARCEGRCYVIDGDGQAALMLEVFALSASADAPVAITVRDLSAPVEIQCVDLEPVFGVTHGEHQVIVHLLQGQSSSEIAEQSGKSILTVRTHVKRAYGKIGVKTRGQLFARLAPYLLIR